MTNIELIKDKFNKNPFILKSLLKMDNIESINQKYIVHFMDIFKKHSQELKTIKLAYNNYHNFIDLYKAVLKITDTEAIYTDFSALSLDEKEVFLKTHDIPFKKDDDKHITIQSYDYETTKLIGSNKWCIYNSKTMWDRYNKGKTHLIIATDNNLFGLSLKNDYFKCFDNQNDSVQYATIQNKLPTKFQNILLTKYKNLENNNYRPNEHNEADYDVAALSVFIQFFSFIFLASGILELASYYSITFENIMRYVIGIGGFVFGFYFMVRGLAINDIFKTFNGIKCYVFTIICLNVNFMPLSIVEDIVGENSVKIYIQNLDNQEKLILNCREENLLNNDDCENKK